MGAIAVPIPRRLRAALFAACAAAGLAGPVAAEPYRVAPGDMIALSLYGQPELSGPYRVREDGALALHLIGAVSVSGLTLPEIEAAIAEAVRVAFGGAASVIVEMAAWRDVFVVGDVASPGAHAYSPGLTVVQAVALAGGQRRLDAAGGDTARRLVDERRRLLLARAQIDEAEATIAAIDEELERLQADGGLPEELEAPGGDDLAADGEDRAALQAALIRSRREVVAQAVDGARRQRALALEEASLFGQRREIVARQLEATEANLADIDSLVARGLARRDRQLALSVTADDYRADFLEIAAFEARARQTVQNAESTAAVAVGRYREQLVADRLRALQGLEAATVDFVTSLEYLQLYGDASSAVPTLDAPAERFEIVRGDETLPAGPSTVLRPGDVLRMSLVAPAS